MLPYCSIGKINLIPALGISEKTSTEIDRHASGCYSCPHFAAMLRGDMSVSDKCLICSSRKAVHKNEFSKFGNRQCLTKSEIIVFLALHLQGVSSVGIVSNVTVSYLSDVCYVSKKTVYMSLRGLVDKNYIYLQREEYGVYTVLINNYNKYFATASEGGRGYIVFTKDLFDQLIVSPGGINALRYSLRCYINIDIDSKQDPNHNLTHQESIRKALQYMPGYYRPCHIRGLINRFMPSAISANESAGNIVIQMDNASFGESVKQSLLDEKMTEIGDVLDDVLNELKQKQQNGLPTSKMSELAQIAQVSLVRGRASGNKKLKPEDIVKNDSGTLKALAQSAVVYGTDAVLDAIKRYWTSWAPSAKADPVACIRNILDQTSSI